MADTSLIFNIIAKTDQAEKGFDRVRKHAALLGAAAGVLAVKFGKDSVHAFVEAEEAQKKLQFAFKKFPGLADTNIDRLRDLNTALARKTKFDDDNIASGQAVLAQFKLTGKQLTETTPLLLDYASKMGKDVPAAAMDVGKALLGNAKALKNIGITYKATGDATQDYANITQLMREKVGGFARGEGKTAAGQAAILQNQLGELEETAGSKLVPALTKTANILLKVVGFVQDNSTAVGALASVVGGGAVAFYTVTKAMGAFNVVAKAMGSEMTLALGPVGLVIIGVAALAAGLIYAYKKSETFRNIVNGAFSAVAAAGQAMWNGLKAAFGFIVDKFLWVAGMIVHAAAKAFGWVHGIGPQLKAAAREFDTFADRVNASLSGIQRTIPISFVAIGPGAPGPQSRYAGKPLPVDGRVGSSKAEQHLKDIRDSVVRRNRPNPLAAGWAAS